MTDNISDFRSKDNIRILFEPDEQGPKISSKLYPKITKDKLTEESGALFDPLMGPYIDGVQCVVPGCGGYMTNIATDKIMCPGHPGIIKLHKPIYHIYFVDMVLIILNSFNFHTYIDDKKEFDKIGIKCLYDLSTIDGTIAKGSYKGISSSKDIALYLRNKGKRSDINFPGYIFQKKKSIDNENYIIEIVKSDDDMTTIDITKVQNFLGLFKGDRQAMQDLKKLDINVKDPVDYILRIIIVMANKYRSNRDVEGKATVSNKTNRRYQYIIKANNALYSNDNDIHSLNIIYRNFSEIMNDPSDANSSVNQKLKGKKGLFRGTLGSNVFSGGARGVAVPNNKDVKPGQIGLNKHFFTTIDVEVTEDNINEINEMVKEGLVEKWYSKDKQYFLKKIPIIRKDLLTFLFKVDTTNIPQTTSLKSEIGVVDVVDAIDKTGKVTRYIMKKDRSTDINTINSLIKNNVSLEVYSTSKHLYSGNINIGDTVVRRIKNGDIVLANRFPTLHKGSMIALEVVLLDNIGYAIAMHTSTCPTLNLDFDGDDMNINKVSSIKAQQELWNKARFYKNLRNPANGKMYNGFIQNPFVFMFQLSKEIYNFTMEEVDDILENKIDFIKSKKSKFVGKQKEYFRFLLNKYNIPYNSGKAILSALLPEDMHHNIGNILIREGIFISGTLTKGSLQTDNKSLMQYLFTFYDEETIVNFIDQVYHVSDAISELKGFTLTYGDFFLNEQPIEDRLKTDLRESMKKKLYSKNVGEDELKYILSKTKMDNIVGDEYQLLKNNLGFSNMHIESIIRLIENTYIDQILKKLPYIANAASILKNTIELTNDEIIRSFVKAGNDKKVIEDALESVNIDIIQIIEKKIDVEIKEIIPTLLTKIRNTGNITIEDIKTLDITDEEDFNRIKKIIEKNSKYAFLSDKIKTVMENADKINSKGGISEEEIDYEIKMQLNKAKDEIITYAMKNVEDENNLKKMIESKTVGSDLELAKMTSQLGQLIDKEGARPQKTRVVSQQNKYLVEERGYCPKSFTQGLDLNILQQFEQSIRGNIIATYISSPQAGYLKKRLDNLMSVVRKNSSEMLTYKTRIIATSFGELGYNIENTMRTTDGFNVPVDPISLIDRLNNE